MSDNCYNCGNDVREGDKYIRKKTIAGEKRSFCSQSCVDSAQSGD